MYGLYLARELFPDAMFYFSEETHYSVLKNVRVLNARHIMIRRQDNGEIDYDDLEAMIRVNRGPAGRDNGQRGHHHAGRGGRHRPHPGPSCANRP